MSIRRNFFVLAALGVFSLSTLAQDQPAAPSREQVRAEAAAALASGQIARGELPFGVAAAHGPSTVSSAEVRAQAVAAVAAGQIGRGEIGVAPAAFESTKTRAEVRAETRVALQLGLLQHGEAPAPEATAAQLELIHVAGERAREAAPVLASNSR